MIKFLNKYNPFPKVIWILFVVFFIAGYFTGGIIQRIAIETNHLSTVKFVCNYPKN